LDGDLEGERVAERLWCVEFAMLYPDDSGGWLAERCRSFAVLQFSRYLHSKPSGAWALMENTNGTHQWAPVKSARIGPKMLAIRDAVSAMPGCTVEEAVQAVDAYMPDDGHYPPLDRALRAGLIVADWPDRERARLFATGAARRTTTSLSPGRRYSRHASNSGRLALRPLCAWSLKIRSQP
jgi:hypothetical protein